MIISVEKVTIWDFQNVKVIIKTLNQRNLIGWNHGKKATCYYLFSDSDLLKFHPRYVFPNFIILGKE